MVVNMKGKHLASLHDLTKEEIWQILKTAETLKIKQKTGEKDVGKPPQFAGLSYLSLRFKIGEPSYRPISI